LAAAEGFPHFFYRVLNSRCYDTAKNAIKTEHKGRGRKKKAVVRKPAFVFVFSHDRRAMNPKAFPLSQNTEKRDKLI
jgi:hypothetical protein